MATKKKAAKPVKKAKTIPQIISGIKKSPLKVSQKKALIALAEGKPGSGKMVAKEIDKHLAKDSKVKEEFKSLFSVANDGGTKGVMSWPTHTDEMMSKKENHGLLEDLACELSFMSFEGAGKAAQLSGELHKKLAGVKDDYVACGELVHPSKIHQYLLVVKAQIRTMIDHIDRMDKLQKSAL